MIEQELANVSCIHLLRMAPQNSANNIYFRNFDFIILVNLTLSIIKFVMWLSELLLLAGWTSLSGNSNILDWGSRELSPVQKGDDDGTRWSSEAGLWLVEAGSRDLIPGL